MYARHGIFIGMISGVHLHQYTYPTVQELPQKVNSCRVVLVQLWVPNVSVGRASRIAPRRKIAAIIHADRPFNSMDLFLPSLTALLYNIPKFKYYTEIHSNSNESMSTSRHEYLTIPAHEPSLTPIQALCSGRRAGRGNRLRKFIFPNLFTSFKNSILLYAPPTWPRNVNRSESGQEHRINIYRKRERCAIVIR